MFVVLEAYVAPHGGAVRGGGLYAAAPHGGAVQ